MPNIYFYLLAYFILIIGISYYVSRKQDNEDFLIAGRNRGEWQIMASKFAGAIGAGFFITYTGFAYEYGPGVLAVVLGLIIGFLTFAYWAAPKVHKNSKKEKFYTVGDFVYSKTHNEKTRTITNQLINLITFSWLLVGIIGGAKIISDFGFITYPIAVILMAGITLAYILIAGYKAVVITDVIQATLIVGLLLLVTFSITGTEHFISLLSVEAGPLNIGVVISFFLYGLLSVYTSPSFYQLSFAAKNKKKLTQGFATAILPIILVATLIMFIGLFMAKTMPGLDSGLVFTEALKHFLNPTLLPWAIVLFFAGVMSSSDTGIFAIASHYKKNTTVKNVRKTATHLMIITTIIALFFSDIVDVSILAGGITLTLAVAMIYTLNGGRKTKKFLASCTLSLTGLTIGILTFGIEPIIAAPTFIGGILGLLWKE